MEGCMEERQRSAAEKALDALKQAADKARRSESANLVPTNAAKAKELLEEECRVTEEMLQRRATV